MEFRNHVFKKKYQVPVSTSLPNLCNQWELFVNIILRWPMVAYIDLSNQNYEYKKEVLKAENIEWVTINNMILLIRGRYQTISLTDLGKLKKNIFLMAGPLRGGGGHYVNFLKKLNISKDNLSKEMILIFFFFSFLKRVKQLNILNHPKRDLLVVWVF